MKEKLMKLLKAKEEARQALVERSENLRMWKNSAKFRLILLLSTMKLKSSVLWWKRQNSRRQPQYRTIRTMTPVQLQPELKLKHVQKCNIHAG